MSTSKRGVLDDMSEQNDDMNLSGAPAPLHAARTRDDDPCPSMSCACTGEFHSTTPRDAERIHKAQKFAAPSDVEQDMDKKEVDIARTTRTVRVRPENSLLRRSILITVRPLRYLCLGRRRAACSGAAEQ